MLWWIINLLTLTSSLSFFYKCRTWHVRDLHDERVYLMPKTGQDTAFVSSCTLPTQNQCVCRSWTWKLMISVYLFIYRSIAAVWCNRDPDSGRRQRAGDLTQSIDSGTEITLKENHLLKVDKSCSGNAKLVKQPSLSWATCLPLFHACFLFLCVSAGGWLWQRYYFQCW